MCKYYLYIFNNKLSISFNFTSFRTVHVLFSMENAHIQPASDYAKTPYLHLNVARSYNIARSPHKAHIKEYVNKDRHSTLLERNSFFYSMPNIKYVL